MPEEKKDQPKDAPVTVTSPAQADAWVRAPDPSETPVTGAKPAASGGKAKPVEPLCPTCSGPLLRYAGTNPHKQGSGWCQACGGRHPLEQ